MLSAPPTKTKFTRKDRPSQAGLIQTQAGAETAPHVPPQHPQLSSTGPPSLRQRANGYLISACGETRPSPPDPWPITDPFIRPGAGQFLSQGRIRKKPTTGRSILRLPFGCPSRIPIREQPQGRLFPIFLLHCPSKGAMVYSMTRCVGMQL